MDSVNQGSLVSMVYKSKKGVFNFNMQGAEQCNNFGQLFVDGFLVRLPSLHCVQAPCRLDRECYMSVAAMYVQAAY